MTLAARIRKVRGALSVDVAFDVAKTLVLVGPNGAGKTTTLLLLLGILPPDEGIIRLGEDTLFDSERGVDETPERRGIGYFPQDGALFPHLTVLDNVAFGPRARGASLQQARTRAREVLEQLQLSRLAARQAAELSGGEKQKVALARAIATRPRALLLDEPFAGLDADAKRASRAFLRERLDAFQGPSIVVLHDRKDVEALDAPVAVIDAGRMVQQGTLQQIREDPRTPYARNFIQAET